MKEEIRRIMRLVQEGKLSPDDAAELIDAFSDDRDEEPEEAAAEATAEAPPEGEPAAAEPQAGAKGENPFASLLSGVERITKDVSQNINWKEIASQVRDGVVKGVDAVRSAAEESGMSIGSIFGSQASKKVDLPLAVPEGKVLIVKASSAKLKVQGGAALGSMDLTLAFRGGSQEEAQAKADAYHPVIEETDQAIILRLQDRPDCRVSGTIYVPARASLEAELESGSLSVLDTEGPCRVKATGASIEMRGLKGSVEAQVSSGDVRLVETSASLVSIETKSGDIALKQVSGSLNLRTSSGDISLSEVGGRTISLDTASGSIQGSLSEPVSGSLIAKTVSGDIRMEVPEGSDARVSLSTLQGAVSCGLELQDIRQEEMKITGRLGEGAGMLDLSAVHGDLSLNLKAAEIKAEKPRTEAP